jgi:hypothetical protein
MSFRSGGGYEADDKDNWAGALTLLGEDSKPSPSSYFAHSSNSIMCSQFQMSSRPFLVSTVSQRDGRMQITDHLRSLLQTAD